MKSKRIIACHSKIIVDFSANGLQFGKGYFNVFGKMDIKS